MLWHLLGWLTVGAITLTSVGTSYLMWLSLARPWAFRSSIHVPREVDHLEWEPAAQDNPIPWI